MADPEHVLAEVNERHARSWVLRDRLTGGYNQGAFVVSDDDALAVLKWQEGATDAGRADALAVAVAAAQRNGWPTATWIAWGETTSGWPYHVVEFVDAATVDTFDPDLAAQVIDAIERQADLAPRGVFDYSEHTRRVLLDDATRALAIVASHSPVGRALVDEVRSASAPHAAADLPTADLVHGNLDSENVLVRDGKVAAFVDVLGVGRGTRAYDLASLAVVSSLWQWDRAAHDALVTAGTAVAGAPVLLLSACAQLLEVLAFGVTHWPDDVDALARRGSSLVRKLAAEAAFTDRSFHKVAPVPAGPRPSIYECRKPVRDWIGDLFDTLVPLPPDGRVLDAGCGPGAYVPAAHARLSATGTLVALDINHDRVGTVDVSQAERIAGDVQALPFPDGTFDVVLAMHMLYHVPDLAMAVRELRRVLRDGGVLYAFTNSELAQFELTELYMEHGGSSASAMGDARFSNESGGRILELAFAPDDVELHELCDSELVVTDPECIVDEFERLRYTLEPGLRAGAEWNDLIDGVRRDATSTVAEHGAFRISENHGLFVCRKRG